MVDNLLRRLRSGVVFTALPIIAFSIGSAAMAAEGLSKSELAEQIGASERVNYSGKLRMLSQRVIATGCNYAAGIDPQESGKHMQAARDEFALIVDALENGNADLGMNGAEKRKKTLARIEELKAEWKPLAGDLDSINSAPAAATVESAAVQSGQVLSVAKLLVSDLSAQYSDPAAMVQANAMLIDISGRQRMLTQRMSKNICLAASGITTEAAKSELAATAEMFETSLNALRSGMQAAGINPPPNSEIAEGLSIVQANWTEMKPAVETILAGGTLSDDERARVYHGMNQMTGNMNKVVGMYSEASKHN